MPVPIVIITASRQPRAAPARCSARSGKVGVVIDVDRQPEALGHHVGEGDVGQRQVDGDHGDSGALIDQAGNPEADRLDLAARRLANLVDRVNGRLEQRRLVETRYRPLGAMVDREVHIDRAGQ